MNKAIPKEGRVPFKVTSFRHFTYTTESLGMVCAREFINGIVKHTFSLRTGRLQLCLPSEKAYPTGCKPIQKKKINDIIKLKQYIPHEENIDAFFSELFAWPTIDKDEMNNEII